MKVAVVFNRDSQNVINLFGQPNREKIGLQLIKRIVDDLKGGGHQATSFEADKDLIDRLEDFMPRVVKGERPGLVLNLSYGIQGQARYTHVPSILEMVGIPYVGSGPLAHSIALDKVITKMVLVQHGLPTPAFAVLEHADFPTPDVPYPCIVKPKHEAVSFGIRVCNNEEELREAAGRIFEMFGQAVLVEQFVEGREINVGLLGNGPPEALPPVELSFGTSGPTVYSYEDKIGKSGRTIELVCPAPIDEEMTAHAQDLAKRTFAAIGCYDCARVDMRLDAEGKFHILEINSLPSLGPRGSYVRAAKESGLEFNDLVNRFVEVASARYFGTPRPRVVTKAEDPQAALSAFITERRDRIESRLRSWVKRSSPTDDVIGLATAVGELERSLHDAGMKPVAEYSDERSIRTWATDAGFEDGTLLALHLDVPLTEGTPAQSFRREPEWLYGDGIGTSRGPLVMTEFALRALRHMRALRRRKIGVVVVLDEGRDLTYSREKAAAAMARARQVLVLRPGGLENQVFLQRRGQRKYRLVVEGEPGRPGKSTRQSQALVWFAQKVVDISALSSRQQRLSASVTRVKTESFPMLFPHRVSADLLVTYVDPASADEVDAKVREILGRKGPKWRLERISDRPPLVKRSANQELATNLGAAAETWDIPLKTDESVWPSMAGLAPASTAVICGLGPVARDLYTPNEAVSRLSLIQRTLLLGSFLLNQPATPKR